MLHAKRILTIWCAVCLCAAAPGACAQSPEPTVAPGHLVDAPQVTIEELPQGITPGSRLNVGLQTPMTGAFGLSGWSNNASDLNVRTLLQGCETVSWSGDQSLYVNQTVVTNLRVENDTDGNQTYTIRLAENLAYSDGTPIGAVDYLFALLLLGSGELVALGAQPQRLAHIKGADAYLRRESDGFAGLHLLDAHTFSITVEPDLTSYFYGLAAMYAIPLPIHVIAPGCTVVDDGDGARIDASGSPSGAFTEAMLRETLLGDGDGYLYRPQVTSGPYTLESFDADTGEAVLLANPRFPGNYERRKPSIERLCLRYIPSGTIIGALQRGEIDLAVQVNDASAIQAGSPLMKKDSGFSSPAYLRSGLAFLAFACEEGPTASTSVRRALAMALDIDALTDEVGGPTAIRVYGYYGLGQWMTLHLMERYGGGLSNPDELSALAIHQDIDAANALLDADGWTFSEDGGAYVPGEGSIRHRNGEDGLEPLSLRFAQTENNAAADVLLPRLREAANALGIRACF